MTLRQGGGALGIALLGSLVADTYPARLDTSLLPAPAAEAARESLSAAHTVADRLGLPGLARSADAAYVDGMATALVTCGVTALAAALLAAAHLPDPGPRADADADVAAAEADGRQ
ncbi:hypothetical protein ACFYOV_13430 [Streptomyces sp. NPDC005931]|uniref:hypothetical protein n=1 Tax=Streptomyces sp. NPDC005931 TaxID=3364737 RepID=UPI0036AC37CF